MHSIFVNTMRVWKYTFYNESSQNQKQKSNGTRNTGR